MILLIKHSGHIATVAVKAIRKKKSEEASVANRYDIATPITRGRELMEWVAIQKPKIRLSQVNRLTKNPPIDVVRAMDEDSFEDFISEWLYSSFKNDYLTIHRFGKSGDKGRDIVAERPDGSLDIFQCKHYDRAINFSDILPEIGKLIVYTFRKTYPVPCNYYFVAPHNLSGNAQDDISDADLLREKVLSSWANKTSIQLSERNTIPFEGELKTYAEQFDFSIFRQYPIEKVIAEYLQGPYSFFRFGSLVPPDVTQIEVPDNKEDYQRTYMKQLLVAYSDKTGNSIQNPDELLTINKNLHNHMENQRRSFYKALSVERASEELFYDNEFQKVKDEIRCGVESAYDCDEKRPYERMRDTIDKAKSVSVSTSPLDYELHWIGNREKEGTCHILVDEGEMVWDWDSHDEP